MHRNSLRERYEKKRKERQDILGTGSLLESTEDKKTLSLIEDTDTEKCLIKILSNKNLILPTNSKQIFEQVTSLMLRPVEILKIHQQLENIAQQNIIELKNVSIKNEAGYEIIQVHNEKLHYHYHDILNEKKSDDAWAEYESSQGFEDEPREKKPRESSALQDTDIMSLLSLPSTKEKQNKQVGEEILELLSKPTAKEKFLTEKFKSQGGTQVMEFCPHGTRVECMKAQQLTDEATSTEENDEKSEKTVENNDEAKDATRFKCNRLHFKKIIQGHTDVVLGDCSFLNTCFHMSTCKYVHYQVDNAEQTANKTIKNAQQDEASGGNSQDLIPKRSIEVTLNPAQWIQCDLRYLDMSCLGKFAVIMADPPWDIHMELPYGTMSDDEMRELGVPALQDDGLIFLWVTGRAMELGRECLKLWGYERVDELIWVKTNQLQRIIRTGRTGHWLNHGKEHCLVGLKGKPKNLNRGLDCDVIVAEVRATSHKPDEVYGIIERLSPGTRKIELFGRQHNVQPNWLTIGNQLDGVKLVDPELINSFQKRYPDGNCMISKKSFKSDRNYIKDLIVKETEISTNHLTPEIKLRLITKNCRLFHSTQEENENSVLKDPFWGFYWPGGMSVTRYILDNPHIIKGKKVLDFGSGCGATAIACKLNLCEMVIANDIDVNAEAAIKLNAALNNVHVMTDTRNLINDPSTFSFDIIIFGDVFYDEDFAKQLLPWIRRLVSNGKTCLIGDPGRHALSKELKLLKMAQYELPVNSCLENHGFHSTKVFKVIQ
ncbi:CLUMA_CG016432, isoform A [Clunio marinus]|uniref:mRNA m(6)A methyltransferase n=1 Tax=Clunio marinus TaxID=568069 RepID=A0A1J1ISQ6_9DIPT|nr:CLUMA_CG016432, isoform A [Clunio marinus]